MNSTPEPLDLVLRDVHIDGQRVDIGCRDGVIAAVAGPNQLAAAGHAAPAVAGQLVLTAPVEMHAHLDKALTADLFSDPVGDLGEAIDAWQSAYHERTVEEISGRALAAVLRMVDAGYVRIRTHVDCGPGIDVRAVEALVALKAAVADVVDVEVCAMASSPLDASILAMLDSALGLGADLVGGYPHVEADVRAATYTLLDRAAAHGVGVDLHVDETLDPSTMGLVDLCEFAAEFPHQVTASHCCSLGMADAQRQRDVSAEVAAADITVVALPLTNLYLHARSVRSAPPRGLTAVTALRAAGARVVAGSDNLQDPFHVLGRGDPFETAAVTVTSGHVDVDTGWAMVADEARAAVGLDRVVAAVGAPADFLVVPARCVRAAVADAPAQRTVVRAGRVVSATETHTTRPSLSQ